MWFRLLGFISNRMNDLLPTSLLKLCLDIQAINRSIEQKQFAMTLKGQKQGSIVRKYLRNLEG